MNPKKDQPAAATGEQPHCSCGVGDDAYLARHSDKCDLNRWAQPSPSAPSSANTCLEYDDAENWLDSGGIEHFSSPESSRDVFVRKDLITLLAAYARRSSSSPASDSTVIEALRSILSALKGSRDNQYYCIEVAEKALAGWSGLRIPPMERSNTSDMKLKIQVLNDVNAVVLNQDIQVPREIPYPPDATVGGPISMWGLKTAIDYALTQKLKENQ